MQPMTHFLAMELGVMLIVLQLTKGFVDAGVDIVDVGGESTRPKAFMKEYMR